jgi:hypothetical protein
MVNSSAAGRGEYRAKRHSIKRKSTASIAGFGHPGLIFDEEDVIRLLRVEIEKDGTQSAWARRHRIERSSLNAMLSGRIPVSKTVAEAVGLRRTYTLK